MFSFNKNHLYIALVVLGLYALTSYGSQQLIGILLTLPGVLLAMTVHEYAHAWMATHYGDTTARRQGRLTLNPLAHIDPVGIFLLIFAHIGWGKPVQVNYNNLTTNKSRGYCEAMISLAGPLSNFILAVILTVVLYLLSTIFPGMMFSEIGAIILVLIEYAITVNIGLGVFNLIPLPPLDGEKIFRNILPNKIKAWLIENNSSLQFLFMLLWITGLLGYIVTPVISGISGVINTVIAAVFGIFI